MKTKITITIALLLALAGCNEDDNANNDGTSAQGHESGSADESGSTSDGAQTCEPVDEVTNDDESVCLTERCIVEHCPQPWVEDDGIPTSDLLISGCAIACASMIVGECYTDEQVISVSWFASMRYRSEDPCN